jgi:hypothetical protein
LGNVIEGNVIGEKEGGGWKVESGFGVFDVDCEHKHRKAENVDLLVRPLTADAKREPNSIHGIVADVIFQQDRFKVTLENGVYVYLPQRPTVGEKIDVAVKVECLG